MASSIFSVSQAPCFIANNGSQKSYTWLYQSSLSSNSIIVSSKLHHPPRPLSSSTASVVETDDDDDGQNVSRAVKWVGYPMSVHVQIYLGFR